MPTAPQRAGGFTLIETAIGAALLGGLMIVSISLQRSAGEVNAQQLARQRCIAAGRATLDSLTATGRPLDDEDVRRLWPGVEVHVEYAAGEGDWAGLTLARATAEATGGGYPVRVDLARYLPTGTPAEGGAP